MIKSKYSLRKGNKKATVWGGFHLDCGGGAQPRVNLSYPNACELLRAAAKTYQNPLFCKHLSRNFAGCFVAGRVAADAGSIARLGIEPGS